MSITELSTRVSWLAALAIVALLFAGRRKPARAWRRAPRDPDRANAMVLVEHSPSTLYRPAGPFRRIFAVIGLGVIAVVAAALAAITITVVLSWTVTAVTDRL